MNCLIGQKIAITSNKPQTTRNRIQTVYTSEEGQIVFLDTQGIHKAKNKLGNYMVGVAERTLSEVDVVLWLVEPTTYIGGVPTRSGCIWPASDIRCWETPYMPRAGEAPSLYRGRHFMP